MQSSVSSVGKSIRMNRIFKEDGRAVMVAINHGLGMGPIQGIEHMDKILDRLIPEGPDSLTIHKGIAVRYQDHFAGKTALVLKASNVTRHFGPYEIPVAEVEEAAALGADAIAVGLSLCDELEKDSIMNTAAVVREAERLGMPTVAHSYPNGGLIDSAERYSIKNVGYATRVALELGIDIIKTFWTGDADSFSEIVKLGYPAKVVISGGPKCNTLKDCFDMTYQGMQAGAHGITYGRNIWQHEYPDAVLRGLAAIVHKGATVDEAMKIAEDCAGVHLV